ncbi:hypothetical protein ACIP9C_04455 [Lysinibacillus sp. NPDC093210]|uniref:hypothetical protein n=1 Tax=Lysinibacillus sp. NPDC093210 TaxID=3364133 RepID=UPI0037FD2D3A
MRSKHQKLDWLQFVYENCERVGISRVVIERFEKKYISEGKEECDRLDAITKRT